MVYADYEFYREHYLGEELTEKEFCALAIRASAKIDCLINGEIDPDDICDELKFAVCEVSEILKSSNGHNGINYERNDGYWISYEDKSQIERKICSAVKTWLCDTGLLYRGRDF